MKYSLERCLKASGGGSLDPFQFYFKKISIFSKSKVTA
jgi:hypothetical protein